MFAFGYLSHLTSDVYPVLYLGREYYFFPNLFWPLMDANPDLESSFAANMPYSGLKMIVSAAVIAFSVSTLSLRVMETQCLTSPTTLQHRRSVARRIGASYFIRTHPIALPSPTNSSSADGSRAPLPHRGSNRRARVLG